MIAALVAAPAFSISRADLLRGAGVASAVTIMPAVANALSLEPADNEIVPYQVLHPNKLDVNNSPVADYMKVSGHIAARFVAARPSSSCIFIAHASPPPVLRSSSPACTRPLGARLPMADHTGQ